MFGRTGAHTCKQMYLQYLFLGLIAKMTKQTENKLVEFKTTHLTMHNFCTCGWGPYNTSDTADYLYRPILSAECIGQLLSVYLPWLILGPLFCQLTSRLNRTCSIFLGRLSADIGNAAL